MGKPVKVHTNKKNTLKVPPGKPSPCPKTFTKASDFRELVALVRAAETKLAAGGITDKKDQLKALRGIYYGPTWSLDFKVEKSAVRNLGFETYTQSISPPMDPRVMLNCGLFDALQASQDMTESRTGRHLDFGHLMIGLDARNAPIISLPFPSGGTGTEIVTWLGDLGGGAGNLAVARGSAPSTNVSTRFSGSDFGGSINLEGDIAGFVVGRGSSTSVVAPTVPAGKGIADMLNDYLSPGSPGSEWTSRATTFMQMHGGTFDASNNPSNRSALIAKFAPQIATFACQYLASRLADGKFTAAQLAAATKHVTPCSEEVAETFVDALDRCHKTGATLRGAAPFPAPKPAGAPACGGGVITILKDFKDWTQSL